MNIDKQSLTQLIQNFYFGDLQFASCDQITKAAEEVGVPRSYFIECLKKTGMFRSIHEERRAR